MSFCFLFFFEKNRSSASPNASFPKQSPRYPLSDTLAGRKTVKPRSIFFSLLFFLTPLLAPPLGDMSGNGSQGWQELGPGSLAQCSEERKRKEREEGKAHLFSPPRPLQSPHLLENETETHTGALEIAVPARRAERQ